MTFTIAPLATKKRLYQRKINSKKNWKTQTQLENMFIHDKLLPPSSETTRFYNQNLGRLYQRNESLTMGDVIETTQENEFDFIGASEINLDTTKRSVREEIYNAVHSYGKYFTKFALSQYKSHSRNKPGGFLMLAEDSIMGRKTETFQDRHGRWVGISLLGKQHTTLHVLTAYRPCPKPKGSSLKGRTTTYAQQELALKAESGKY